MADAKPPQPRGKSDGASTGSPLNPYRTYRYRITIAEGGIIGHFTRCGGIKIVTDCIACPTSDRDGGIVYLPGKTHYLPVILEDGVVKDDSLSLWNWMENTRRYQRDKRSIMLDYLGPEPNDVHGYVLEEAWIMGWECQEMDGLSNEYAKVKITIAYDAVSRRKG
jgi:phage tail-like protein